VLRKLKKRLINWLLKDVVIDELKVRRIIDLGNTGYFNMLKFTGKTSDPSLQSGLVWFRSDQQYLKISPDGSLVKNIFPADWNDIINKPSLWQVVKEIEVDTDQGYIDITGLDINTDWFYIIIADLYYAGTSHYHIYVEGDYTNSNYLSITVRTNEVYKEPLIAEYGGSNSTFCFIIVDRPSMGGIFHYASIYVTERAITYSDVILGMSLYAYTNITTIRIASTDSSGIGAGSRIVVFKLR